MGMDKLMGGNMDQMRPMMQQLMRNMMMGGSGMPAMGRMGPLAGMAALRHIEVQIAFYKAECRSRSAGAAMKCIRRRAAGQRQTASGFL